MFYPWSHQAPFIPSTMVMITPLPSRWIAGRWGIPIGHGIPSSGRSSDWMSFRQHPTTLQPAPLRIRAQNGNKDLSDIWANAYRSEQSKHLTECSHPSSRHCLTDVAYPGPCSIPDATMARQLGLNEVHLQELMNLPGTVTMLDLKSRLVALSQWNTSLQRLVNV